MLNTISYDQEIKPVNFIAEYNQYSLDQLIISNKDFDSFIVNQDFSKFIFKDLNISNITFINCNFYGADFTEAKIAFCEFLQCNLENVNWG